VTNAKNTTNLIVHIGPSFVVRKPWKIVRQEDAEAVRTGEIMAGIEGLGIPRDPWS
jgi:hypothetical protein